jgi:CDP-glucose 4,6-dehydratase
MAAQPLVRRSIAQPAETFAINVMGTVHLLEALRARNDIKAILIVTSDKVYANDETGRAFAEGDRLGGKDPYSGSKAAAELAVQSYAKTYFVGRGVPVATARGGNVIGGGDYSEDRLIPDIIRAVASGEPLVLRHPEATRPWQHVLDCLSGYFLFAEGLASQDQMPSSLNFGPDPSAPITVGAVADAMAQALGSPMQREHRPIAGSIEMTALAVDASRARARLGWRDRLVGAAAIGWTADWYRAQSEGRDMRAFTLGQIATYRQLAIEAS